jgi:iron complex outermembrane receptor protein
MKRISGRSFAMLAAGAATVALLPGNAWAQDDQPQESEVSEGDTIVVTGTLLRGITAPGSQTIAISQQDVVATGATSTAQLLAAVPQIGDFNQRPINRGVFNTQQTVNHPDLRNLGSAVLGGGSSATLLLLDGHRLPGMGVRQTIPDSDAIPPGAIERVEIVPDGGSAIYGADAVGGVVNYITRKRFDGVDVRATYGFADDYQTASADITVGKDWGSGSLWATYSYNWHDEIYGRDRDYVQSRDWVLGVPADLTCTPGNVIATSAAGVTTTYGLPNLTAGVPNRCDLGEDVTIYPFESRHSAMIGLTQNLTDNLEIEVKAFYTNRRNESDGGALTATASITTASPFYRSTGDANAGRTQTLNFNFIPILGNTSSQVVKLETYGISTGLTYEFGGNWRLRGLFNYGYGESSSLNQMTNGTALQGFVTAGTFNPYDLTAAVNAGPLAVITDWANFGEGRNELINYRAIADGSLFSLPGGDVRLAIGGEYVIEDFRVQSGVGLASNLSRVRFHGHRNTKAAFGELFVPVFGEGNRTGGFHSLELSAAGRYDDYSDFGGTFNPKLAITYAPVSWIKLRANWSKSFQAPSLADSDKTSLSSITVLPRVITAHPDPALQPTTGQVSVFLSGGGGNLKPQKATIWTVGGDIDPPFIPNLSLSATYYNIKFNDLIAIPPVTSTLLYSAYSNLVQLGKPTPLTTAQLQAFAALAPLNNSQLTPFFTRPQDVYFLVDGRRSNFSTVNTSGIDFSVRYELPTNFGSVYARVSGNYILSREQSAVAGQPFLDLVDTQTKLRVATTLGTTIGGFRGQIVWQHSGGYEIIPQASNLQQARIDAFNVFNLFLQYDFAGESLLKDLTLTLNVDNLLDQNPPLFRGGSSSGGTGGYANGFTLGRLVQFGIRKRF